MFCSLTTRRCHPSTTASRSSPTSSSAATRCTPCPSSSRGWSAATSTRCSSASPGSGKTFTMAQRRRHREPADAGHGAQQDAGGAALPGVPPVLPAERRRVLRQLLRLLPARSLRARERHVHREGIDDQRRDRPHAAVGDAIALRAPRRHHRRQRLVHLRPGLAGGLLRHAAAARARAAHGPRADSPQARRDPVRAQRSRVRPRHLPRPRRHHRGVSVVRGDGAAHRPLRRRDRRARELRSAHRQVVPPPRPRRGLSEVALRHVARPAEGGGRDHQGGARRAARACSRAKASCSKRSGCTSGRCSTSR